MKNRDIQAAWKYHDGTKHSYWSIRNNPHFLDWANRPQPFRIYPNIEPIPLPRDVPQTGVAALSSISEPLLSSRADSRPDVEDLARILYFSAGITKRRKSQGGGIYFRAAACTGALYEIELYVVTGGLPGLDAGVYHFNPADVSLRLLRKGDYRGNLAQATAMEPAVAGAPVTIICTGTYWRNAWKYQARTYRHFGWDNGTLLANMLAVSAASGLPAEIVLGFVDAEVNLLLDLDTRREVSLCLVPIGHRSDSSLAARQKLRRLAWRRSHFRSTRSNIPPCLRCTLHLRLSPKRKWLSGVGSNWSLPHPLPRASKFNCRACRKRNNQRTRSSR